MLKNYKWYIIVGLVFVALIIWLNIALYKIREYKSNEGKIIRDTTIVVKYDTIKITKPVYVSQKVIDTLLVPITDTLRQNDTLYVPIPKTQRYYAKDSLYMAWVSGYKPNLDSIKVFPKTVYSTITNTIYRKPTKIGFGLSVGYGASLINGQAKIAPSVTVGLFYRIW